MDVRREYVTSRKDVSIIGGSFGNEYRMSFGDETYLVRTDGIGPKVVVFANAYEATGTDGKKTFFLVRSLVPMEYHKVVVGRTYEPKVTKKGSFKKTPPIESFPSVIHSTTLTRSNLTKHLLQDGVYDTAPELRATILLVCLGSGMTGAEDWTEDACVDMLASMRSGDMSSVTLNQDGRMSVEIVCEASDMASVATESVIAMDAYIRRMDIIHGKGSALHGSWQDKVRKMNTFGRYGLTLAESLSGNILYSLPSFLVQELDGDAKSVVQAILPSLRLRVALDACEARPGGRRFPTMTMHDDSEAIRKIFVTLCTMVAPDENISVTIDSHGSYDDRYQQGKVLATTLGPVIEDEEEARHVLSVAVSSLGRGAYHSTRLCMSALLGNDWGHVLITEQGDGRPVATEMLLGTTVATEYGDDEWGDWVARSVHSIVGSVAYAEAVKEMIVPVCMNNELDEAWEVLNPTSLLNEHDATTDWHLLANQARQEYAKWKSKEKGLLGDPDPCDYDEWEDYDWDNWDSEEESLYMSCDVDASVIWKADRFISICTLFHACRHVFRYLDGRGWRALLAEYPALRLVVGDDGRPATIHNDVVAASYKALWSLVTEDGYDEDGNPTGAMFPSVVMDDGSVMGLHAETAPEGGYAGRIACDGGDACYLFPADMGSFETIGDIARFLFSLSVALPESDETGKDDGKDNSKSSDEQDECCD